MNFLAFFRASALRSATLAVSLQIFRMTFYFEVGGGFHVLKFWVWTWTENYYCGMVTFLIWLGLRLCRGEN